MIRVLEWQEAAFLILMVLVTVAAIDVVSRRLRAAIIGAPRSRAANSPSRDCGRGTRACFVALLFPMT